MSSTSNVRLVRKQSLQRKSPLLRKTPLKRHVELRRISLRRARLIRAAQAERRAFVEKFRRCAYPGCRLSSTCIHEIAFGQGVRQCALKQMLDPEHYDLARINVLRGRSPHAIREEEVTKFLAGARPGTAQD